MNPRATVGTTRRWMRTGAATLLSLAVVGTIAIAIPAAADPNGDGSSSTPLQPSTAAEAKQAWLDAADKAEAANEDLLTAKDDEAKAKQDLADARIGVAQANLAASSAQASSVQAAAEYEAYRAELAQFASASFRGADFGELAAVLTSDSTSEFLDKMSSLDQVAGSTRLLMMQAMQAKTAAADAAAKAADAQQAAVDAQQRADQAVATTAKATKAVSERKDKLDQQTAIYHRLFSALSGEERAAAMQAQQAEWERQARAAEQQRAAEEAAQQATGGTDPGADANPQAAPADEPGAGADARTKATKVVEAALSQLGKPYVYGSSGPNSFDCSGLTSWAWRQVGVSIPRTSSGQAGLKVVPLDQLEPGDLITYYSPVHHVALYIGNGQIIHASTEGKPVFITSMYRGGPYPVGHRVNY